MRPGLYTLPTDPEEAQYVKPSSTAYGGYSYQRPWKEEPLMAKIIGVIVFVAFFPPCWAVYALVWYFLIR